MPFFNFSTSIPLFASITTVLTSNQDSFWGEKRRQKDNLQTKWKLKRRTKIVTWNFLGLKKRWPRSFPFASNQQPGKVSDYNLEGVCLLCSVPGSPMVRKRCWLNNGGTSGKLDTKSAQCWMKEQGSLCGPYTVDRVLILKKPMKGIQGFCLCKKERLRSNFCHSPPGGCLEFLPPRYSQPWPQGSARPSATATLAGGLQAPTLLP